MDEQEKENSFYLKFFGWFLSVVGVFMLFYAVKDLSEISKLKNNSVRYQAEITNVSLDTYRVRGRSGSNWIIEYRFELPSGLYEGREVLDEWIHPVVRVGDYQTIYYYKDNPAINRTKSSMHNKKSLPTLIFGLIFSISGVFLLRKANR